MSPDFPWSCSPCRRRKTADRGEGFDHARLLHRPPAPRSRPREDEVMGLLRGDRTYLSSATTPQTARPSHLALMAGAGASSRGGEGPQCPRPRSRRSLRALAAHLPPSPSLFGPGSSRSHSQKPVEAYERIEALLPGPYVELFARTRRAGWESWETNLTKECAAIRERAFLICSRPRRPDAGNEGVSRPCRRTKS